MGVREREKGPPPSYGVSGGSLGLSFLILVFVRVCTLVYNGAPSSVEKRAVSLLLSLRGPHTWLSTSKSTPGPGTGTGAGTGTGIGGGGGVHWWRGPALRPQSMQYGTEVGDADYDGYFEKVLFKDTHGAYPLMIVGDIFFHCPTASVHVVSRYYKRSPQAQNHSDMKVEVVDPVTGFTVPLATQGWYVEDAYETSAVGVFPYAPAAAVGGLCDPNKATRAEGMVAKVTFKTAHKAFTLGPPVPQPPKARFSMVAVFSFNNYMLHLWVQYWSLLGIETFYFFYNGPAEDIPGLNATLSHVKAHIQWVEWPLLHWIITDATDITHGQPMAIVDALQRWREVNTYMFFYDLDEFLVLPRHSGLGEFMDEYESLDHGLGPLVALRTQCAWGLFNLSTAPPLVTIADLNVSDFATYPIVRGQPTGREKYWMNASARRVLHEGWGTSDFKSWVGPPVHNLNLHGIYKEQAMGLSHVRILEPQGHFSAYHIHLLNTRSPERTQDGRDSYFNDAKNKQVDGEVGVMVRRLLLARIARDRAPKGGKAS